MTLAIRKLIIPREHRFIAQGQSVNIVVEIADVELTSVLVNPTSVPVISVYNPSGTALVTEATMTNISTGKYSYSLQTTTSNPVGDYTATVMAVTGIQVARLERKHVFSIKKATTLITFSYLIIKDQSGVLWYWYIANDNTLAVSNAIPVITGKQALVISLSVVPSWLEINNPTPALRYVYPSLTGDATVSATQPTVGSGNVGSPTFVSAGTGSFKIALNVSDEVILATV